jgi:glycogen phosphorylase
MATLDLPGWGYGIRYKYGMFRQALDAGGRQRELPDIWLQDGNPWEVRRDGVRYAVGFGGAVVDGAWRPADTVFAQAYDTPIPGFRTPTVGNLRLWEAVPPTELDLAAFNEGRFIDAVDAARKAAEISAVLYPNDATEDGKLLRLKQQYFFVSASLQDALARHVAARGANAWDKLSESAVFQLNDTHPTVAVAELMRLLMDERGLDWEAAWRVTRECLAFTNHTVMPEALEKWPVAVFGKLLPRCYEIVQRIDAEWRASLRPKIEADVKAALAAEAAVKAAEEKAKPVVAAADAAAVDAKTDAKAAPTPDPVETAVEAALNKTGVLVENAWEPGVKLVNMAHLAIVGSRAVNGVAAIHSQILIDDLFADFYALTPDKFQNKTNGVTPRRWLAFCNPGLASLITDGLGTDAWVKDASLLAGLRPLADDPAFRARWAAVKRDNKARLAAKVEALTGVSLPVDAMFDIQIKRIHEYKRQLMNILSVIVRYKAIKAASPEERAKMTPRAVVFGGKAASAYRAAKKIVRLVTAVAAVVNADEEVGDLLKVRESWGKGEGVDFIFISPHFFQPTHPPTHTPTGRLCPRLQRLPRRSPDPGRRTVATHLHRRHRSVGHVQHEVCDEWVPHHRHHGRRQRGDCRGSGRRQPVHLWRGRGRRAAPARRAQTLQGLRPALPGRPRRHLRRRVRRRGLPARTGGQRVRHGQGQRLVPGGQRLCVLPRRAGRSRRVLQGPGRVDAPLHRHGRVVGAVFVGPHDRPVRQRDLGGGADAAAGQVMRG